MNKKNITPEIVKEVKEFETLTNLAWRPIRDHFKDKIEWLTLHNVQAIINGLYDDLLETELEIKAFQEEKEEEGTKVSELNEIVKEVKDYEIEWDDIIFYEKKKDTYWETYLQRIPVSLTDLDRIVYDYSRKWNNISWPKILTKYWIHRDVWKLIKTRLNVTKDVNACHDIILDRIKEKHWEEWVEQKVVEVSSKAIKSKYHDNFKPTYAKIKEKEFVKKSKRLASMTATLEWAREYIQDYNPKPLDFDVVPRDNNDEVEVVFSDIHLGKMNTKQVLDRVKEMTADIKERPESIIHMICLWDIFENLAKGWMHTGQVETMDWPHWFELLMFWVQVLETMFIELHKAWKDVRFYWIWGNHDRFTANNDDGFSGIGAYITYELIKRGLSNMQIEINILMETRNTLDFDEVRYIIHHWYKWVAKKAVTRSKASEILWERWDSSKYNVLLTWDQHHLEMNNNSDKSLGLICPALAWKNEFDNEIWVSSTPWYLILKRSKDRKPKVTINQF